jgi:TPR repeat protein
MLDDARSAEMSESSAQPVFNSEEELWAYIEEQEDLLNELEAAFNHPKTQEGVTELPASLDEMERLAIQGDAIAQFNLSVAYSKSVDATPDLEKSWHWLLKSAYSGFAPAQHNLGCYYRDIEKNFRSAFDWFMKAAKQNFGPAQFNLGVLYGNANDAFRAFVWFSLAATNGVQQAKVNREKAASLLSQDELNAARLAASAEMFALKAGA